MGIHYNRQMVRFLQISDSHLAADPEFAAYGHNAEQNLIRLVEQINALPYDVDFILHTGDVADDGSREAYERGKAIFQKLRFPIRFVAGNHDDPLLLQEIICGVALPCERYDYTFETGGVQFVVLDSRGAVDPGGDLNEEQLDWLAGYCMKGTLPLVVVLHHQPVPLDVPWLDIGETMPSSMLLRDPEAFANILKKAGSRLRGVLFGHVHRSFQIWQEGIFYCSAASCFAQLKTCPGQREPLASPEEEPGYNLITVDETRIIVQQYSFPSIETKPVLL